MTDVFAPFTAACTAAFQFLVDQHGFTEAKIERLGREVYVRYDRADQTVSIAYEPGMAPIVELFYPSSETGEPPVPWAAKGDVPRSRRIPGLGVKVVPAPGEPDYFVRYLQASAAALAQIEHAWL